MNRHLLLVAVAVALFASPANAGAPGPPRRGAEKFVASQVVVAGKVTAIAKDPVMVERFVGDKEKATFRVATVTIETGFLGAEKLKEIKIGFVPPDPNAKPTGRPGIPVHQLKEGQELLLYLDKHSTADFYVMPGFQPPTDVKSESGKRELEIAKKFAVVLADPLKALKSDKVEVRTEAAALLVIRYRTTSEFAGKTQLVAIGAEENTLIFKALAEGEWDSQHVHAGAREVPSALYAFYHLALEERDGWIDPLTDPKTAPKPGVPRRDYGLVTKDAFVKWRAGPGKDYQIKKLAPK